MENEIFRARQSNVNLRNIFIYQAKGSIIWALNRLAFSAGMLKADRHVAQCLAPFIKRIPGYLTIKRPKRFDAGDGSSGASFKRFEPYRQVIIGHLCVISVLTIFDVGSKT